MGLLKKGIPLLPIDSRKVPFALEKEVGHYAEYIEWMASKFMAVTKTGQ